MKRAFLLFLFLTACHKQEVPVPAAAPRVYPARGVIKELAPDGKTVVIQHEAISNYMAAMTMPFEVHDTNELRGLKPGDAVDFQLMVTATDGWVQHITRIASGAVPLVTNAPPGLEISPALEPLDEGDALPEYHFTNELGQSVSLSQYRGRVVAFTFFFTSCPFPNFCPRMTANFAATAAKLNEMSDAPKAWQLLSISFDPKTDTPERLRDYAEGAHYDPAHWSFLTGAKDQIGDLAEQFGENFWVEGGSISHNLRTVVVDPKGIVRKIFQGNAWTSDELVQEMVKGRAR